ncbi:UDP-2,3-diacylglucosamine hydrolase [Pseudoduganella flava]|uniref:UDP-2,3-diacylglucosamine hydrolase n=1 Tax=Pseudoduganella flava TaxID=871742 RepID=A0A562PK68_9BURK|nr:UDP-2,3-diacylglucosamine diphosphatase [Pseudoduganella flava]QGZ42303.1 UDP-2,3-diacylglucosamine diphosphatase [Pseudoduganella flava]TWI44851.1 UDP-2,3-diacylglucosamine hydrolase [Pseudoduganella flava]
MILFISDLHLQADRPALTEAFLRFVDERARAARRLYLLGDLFEYWAGDDDLDDAFHQRIVAALRALADGGVELFWIAGNRDFLVGARFAEAAGVTLLPETWVIEDHGRRIVLLHGDAQCTDDVRYMAFRTQVRDPAWQQQFLAMPLAQRKQIIAGLRENSRKDQGEKSYEIMDVTPQAIADVFAQTNTTVMIHGHTHRPALHDVDGKLRYVLPDWEPEATPPRGGWIAIGDDGAITRHSLDGTPL